MIKTLYPEQLNGLHNWFLCRRTDDEHTWVEESFITEKQAKRAVWLRNGKERMNGRPEVFYCERIPAEGRTIIATTKGPQDDRAGDSEPSSTQRQRSVPTDGDSRMGSGGRSGRKPDGSLWW